MSTRSAGSSAIHEFNKRAKNKTLKPANEIATVEAPPLIDQATFDVVQAHLRARNPKVTPARVVSGPTLLTASASAPTAAAP